MRLYPLLAVKDVETSIPFYRDLLGFQVVDRYPAEGPALWAYLQRDDAVFTLGPEEDFPGSESVPLKGVGVQFVIRVEDIETLYEELLSKNVKVRSPLTARAYRRKDFSIEDLDGYLILFTQVVQEGDE